MVGGRLAVRRSPPAARPLLGTGPVGVPAVPRVGRGTEGRILYLVELPSLSVWIMLPPKVVWKIEQGKGGNACGTW